MKIKTGSIKVKVKSKEISYLDKEYPKNLLCIKEYPRNLFYIGNNKLLNYSKIVAIVGSRDCTEYGRKYATMFARELAKENICVISGMALGIDAAAHFGAMYEKGGTIAVLAGGLSNIYPKENKWIFSSILENNGCVISEHQDDEPTSMSNFPKRNRIISGIADAILIIEAKYRSGTSITATYAKMQSKKIYCIPSNLDSANGVGTNELILRGANFVTSPKQIIKDMKEKDNNILEKNQIRIIPNEYQEIYNLLMKEKMTNDEVSRKLNKSISQINSVLTMMELDGYIIQESGNMFEINSKE